MLASSFFKHTYPKSPDKSCGPISISQVDWKIQVAYMICEYYTKDVYSILQPSCPKCIWLDSKKELLGGVPNQSSPVDLSSYHWWRQTYSWYRQSSLDCQFLWVLLIRSQCSANTNRLFVRSHERFYLLQKQNGFPSIMDSIILVHIFEKSNHSFIYQTSEHHIPPLHRDPLSSFKSRKGFQGAPSMRGALEHMGAHGTRTCMKWYENDSRLWPLNLFIDI